MTIELPPGITSVEELVERFTNRQPEVEAFQKALEWSSDTPSTPLVFLGESGQGKTTLCAFLAASCLRDCIPFGTVSYDKKLQQESCQVLIDMRNQLASAGVRFKHFDTVWDRLYQLKAQPDEPPSLLKTTINLGRAVLGDPFAIADIATDQLPRAKKWLTGKFGDGWQARLKDMQRSEVEGIMPDAFAEDLELAMREEEFGKEGSAKRIVLFFDGIDCAIDDYAVIRLCELLRSPLIVICGRRISSENLKTVLQGRHLLKDLTNFTQEYSVSYLNKRGVADTDLAHFFSL